MTMSTHDEARIEENVTAIEYRLLQGVFGCRTVEAVESAVTYAAFLNRIGISPENCPVFLRMLEIENHWVIDALIGERDPFLLLSAVQPNRFIVESVLSMLARWHKGSIYPKTLSVILGVLQSVYSSPREGYRIFPLRVADVNALGKHLDKSTGQDDPQNRVVLEVLEKIAQLEDAADAELEEVAAHASAVRNAFFDDRKQMELVIPPVLLVAAGERVEIAPRKRLAFDDSELPPPKKETKGTAPAKATTKPAEKAEAKPAEKPAEKSKK
jgi:hypothetical protein